MLKIFKFSYVPVYISITLFLAVVISLMVAYSPVPQQSNFKIDLSTVRQLADSLPGAKVSEIRVDVVGETKVPRLAAVAGFDISDHFFVYTAYQLIAGNKSLMIDTGIDQALLEDMSPGSAFDNEAFERVSKALDKADQIIITHEHPDHLGGIRTEERIKALAGKLALTQEQLGNTKELERLSMLPHVSKLSGIEYDTYHALAPGVVLIKAPGHTPGTQLVYVQLENKKEYLFVGDVAWHSDNISEGTGRPKFVSEIFLREDRYQVLQQLRTLALIQRDTPINLVVSHDKDQLAELIKNKELISGMR